MRRSGRLSLMIGLLLLVVIVVAGYLYLSGGLDSLTGGGGGGVDLAPTPTPAIRIVVARRVVSIDTVLKPAYVEENFDTKEVPASEVTAENVITKKSQLYNKVARATLDPDVFLREDQFVDASLSYLIPEGKRAFPLLVDRFSGVVGRVVQEDFVDVIVSGDIELQYPQQFPPQYDELDRTPLNINPPSVTLLSAKTVLQDVQVLEVIVLTVTQEPVEGRPTPTPLPAGMESLVEEPALPSTWIFILAVDDQQAEILQFAVNQKMQTQLVLRPRGDHNLVATRGITTWILIESYGLPVPQNVPYPVRAGGLPAGSIP